MHSHSPKIILLVASVGETGRILLGDLIKFFIPLIIFAFIAASIAELKGNAGKLLGYTVAISYLDTIIACALAAGAAYKKRDKSVPLFLVILISP